MEFVFAVLNSTTFFAKLVRPHVCAEITPLLTPLSMSQVIKPSERTSL